jgi:hypothetical protein
MALDPGLPGRFSRTVIFPDYSESELSQIFKIFIAAVLPKGHLKLEHESLADVVGRRLFKNAGQRGFGNARTVRRLRDVALDRSFERRKREERETGVRGDASILTVQDVLGTRPDVGTSAAFKQLSGMVGLHKVKADVLGLMLRLQNIWDAEGRCGSPPQMPFLNRVFIGCPGTGMSVG